MGKFLKLFRTLFMRMTLLTALFHLLLDFSETFFPSKNVVSLSLKHPQKLLKTTMKKEGLKVTFF